VRERQQATLDDLDVEWQREAVIFEEVLRLMGYEVGGRRSEDQIRAMDWNGDVDPIIGVLSRYPLPTSDLVEDP
jgi:hypothetical protein